MKNIVASVMIILGFWFGKDLFYQLVVRNKPADSFFDLIIGLPAFVAMLGGIGLLFVRSGGKNAKATFDRDEERKRLKEELLAELKDELHK